MDFESALAYMSALRRFGVKLGNERFEALLQRIGDPHHDYCIAHVTGTKGKGSTTAMIARILHAHGFRVGAYFSPYVYDVRERVQIDNRMISRADFARLVGELRPHVEALSETPLGQTTEFELKTALGFRFFSERRVDFAAVEVGLGGRLDATNVVAPQSTVITNIGLDHIAILGDTLAKIAAEKAGIIKPGIPLITAAQEPAALDRILEIAAERSAPVTRVLPSPSEGSPERAITVRGAEGAYSIRTPAAEYRGLRCGLRGEYQRINSACAVGAVEALAEAARFQVRPEAVEEGLRTVYLPGRFEIIHRSPLVILDGAHNAMAARALSGELRRHRFRRLHIVVGMIEGHSPDGLLRELAPLASAVYATKPTWIRGQPADVIAERARPFCPDVHAIEPPLAAARLALEAADAQDTVLITGSFYVLGDVPPARLLENS